MSAATTRAASGIVSDPDWDPDNPNGPPKPHPTAVQYDQVTLEQYGYDAAGRLATVRAAQTRFTDNGDGTYAITAPPATGALRGAYQYDLLGRLTTQVDYLGDGSAYAGSPYYYFTGLPASAIANYRAISYDNASRITQETDRGQSGADSYTSTIVNSYGAGSGYALGAVTGAVTTTTKGSTTTTATTSTVYGWYDAAVQQQVSYQANSGQPTYVTTYTNNAAGVLVSAHVGDGRPRDITVTNDALGQALRRDESSAASANPHEAWYRFNGKQLGYTGNNGNEDPNYLDSLAQRTQAPGTGAFRGGAAYGAAYADFDQNYAAINSYEQGASGGSYTVRAGDSLASIAAQLWGDAGLWYKLAQANGLTADSELAAGQTLTVPGGGKRDVNTALSGPWRLMVTPTGIEPVLQP